MAVGIHSQVWRVLLTEVGTGLREPLRASQNKWGLGEASRRRGVHQGHGQAPLGVTIPKHLAAGVLLCLFVLLNLSDRSSGQGKAQDPDSHPLGLSAGGPTWGQECECLSFDQSDPGSLSCGQRQRTHFKATNAFCVSFLSCKGDASVPSHI